MKLITQLLSELGAEEGNSFTVSLGFGAYFQNVKGVEEYTPERIVLIVGKRRVLVEGKNLSVGKFYERDLFLKGEVTCCHVE